MKNYKALILSVPVALLLFAFGTMLSCESHETTQPKTHLVFYEPTSQKSFGLNNQAELNELAKILTRETGEVMIVRDATIVSLTDSQGDYRAISIEYQADEKITRMIVPITEVSADKTGRKTGRTAENTSYYVAEACEMKCIAESCDICTQQVIERCKSQSCTCEGFSSGCNPSIVFPE
jgi:hypothetical protein